MSMKEPLHPGKILHDILCVIGLFRVENPINTYYESYRYTKIPNEQIQNIIECNADIDHIIAYKLAKCIEGTDMAFWLKLQEDYDKYREKWDEEHEST